ncbi:MAG: serine/threonine-protein kinase [Polyangiaceae bacterium]
MGSRLAAGDVIDEKYRVERVLGAGGMGVVLAARHLALGERVAIKVLQQERSASPDAVARFLREGRAAARLRSIHVARVYDVGTLPTGEPYMVMEHLDGQDLSAVLRADGPLSVLGAADFLLQAAEAVAVAHASGIVHRDLKPANLFITRDLDGSKVLKVIDFGISKDARAPAEGDSPDPHATRSDVVMGSPSYMPPEQMRSARKADARSDIWALGAILHAALTGRPPFDGTSLTEIYDSILQGPPSLRAARPDLPPELDAVLHTCLARDPDARYPDVAAFAEALAPFGPDTASARAARIARILTSAAHTAPDLAPLSGASPAHTPSSISDAEAPTASATGAPRDASWNTAPPTDTGTSWSDRTAPTESPAPEPTAPPPPSPPPARRSLRTPLAILAAAATGALLTFALRPEQPLPAAEQPPRPPNSLPRQPNSQRQQPNKPPRRPHLTVSRRTPHKPSQSPPHKAPPLPPRVPRPPRQGRPRQRAPQRRPVGPSPPRRPRQHSSPRP